MKKLTYLFLALLIVACSDDDSSDSNQLFMEKYDGVVWNLDSPGLDQKITFSNEISGIIIYDYAENEGDAGDCTNLIFGEPGPVYGDDNDEIIGYGTWTIQSELEDSIVTYSEIIYNNGNPNGGTKITCAVSSGGNALQIEFLSNDFPDDPAYSNYTIAPDEFPCD